MSLTSFIFNRGPREPRNHHRGTRKASHAQQGRDLEALEPRQLMAVDLTAALGGISSRVNVGATPRVQVTVRNRGNTATTTPVVVDVFAVPTSSTFNLATATPLAEVTRTAAIRARGSQSFRVAVPLAGVAGTGNFRLVAVVDPANTIAETNESNNTAQSRVFAIRAPSFDLRPTFAGVTTAMPTLVGAGTIVDGNVRVQIANSSSSTAAIPAGAQARVEVVARPLGASGTGQDVPLNLAVVNAPVGSLRRGGTLTVDVPIEIPGTLPLGNFRLLARVDTTNALAESNEVNNEVVLSNSITVVDPVTAANLGLSPVNGSVGNLNLFPVNLGFFDVGSVAPVGNTTLTGSSTLVNPLNTTTFNTSPFSATPVISTGLTPLNTLGSTPFATTGLTGMTQTTGFTTLFTGLPPFGATGSTQLATPGLNTINVLGTVNGNQTNGLGLTLAPGVLAPFTIG